MLLRDSIYQAIRHAILTCELRPGQDLREQLLAERYRVSRSPIRDALLRLERDHLVTVLPRQGYRVNPIALSDVDEVFGMRMLIEPACAAGAARDDNAAAATLDQFRQYTEDDAVRQSYFDYNKAFHGAVAEMAGNMRTAVIARDLLEQVDRLLRFSLHGHRLPEIDKLVAEHGAIIDAIQGHDTDRASQLAYQHAAGGRARVIAALTEYSGASASD